MGPEHSKIAFGMKDMGSFNHGQRNCDEFGGEPFYGFNGLVAHRGSSTRKISSMHPVTTNKRCVYKNDGSNVHIHCIHKFPKMHSRELIPDEKIV